MTKRPTISVARIEADEATAKALAEILGERIDAQGTAIAVFERAEGAWAVEATFPRPPDEKALRALVKKSAGAKTARTLTVKTLAPRDWVKASLAGLKPVSAGRFTVHGAHDRGRFASNRIAIEIEAALAFGTGHHATTRGCLLALDRIVKEDKLRRKDQHGRGHMLDLGTGTGVLAMAAAKALRRPVLASDIDATAVQTARRNAQDNRVGSLIEVVRGAGVAAPPIRARAPYRLVLANILLLPLKRLAAALVPLLAADGRIVLSGLLADQVNAALWPYRAHGIFLERHIMIDGWATLVVRRRPAKRNRPARSRAGR